MVSVRLAPAESAQNLPGHAASNDDTSCTDACGGVSLRRSHN